MAWRSNGIWKFKCYARTTIFSTEEELHISNLAISVFQHPLRACGRVREYWINGQPRKSRPRRVGMLWHQSQVSHERTSKAKFDQEEPRRATSTKTGAATRGPAEQDRAKKSHWFGDSNQIRVNYKRASQAQSGQEEPWQATATKARVNQETAAGRDTINDRHGRQCTKTESAKQGPAE